MKIESDNFNIVKKNEKIETPEFNNKNNHLNMQIIY